MKKLNLAIVGYGGMGSYHGNNYLRENAKFEISGIFDIDASRYAAARENGIENYDRFHSKEEIAADASTDAVLIATPNDSHLEYVTFLRRQESISSAKSPWRFRVTNMRRCSKYAIKIKSF